MATPKLKTAPPADEPDTAAAELAELRARAEKQEAALAELQRASKAQTDALQAQTRILEGLALQATDTARMAAQAQRAAPAGPDLLEQVSQFRMMRELMREEAPAPAARPVTAAELMTALTVLCDKVPNILAKWGEARAGVEAAKRLNAADFSSQAEDVEPDQGEEGEA